MKKLMTGGNKIGQKEILTLDPLDLVGHYLVEDVVGSFQSLLGDDTGLLQQVGLDISTRQLTGRAEVDTDELTLLWAGRSALGTRGERKKTVISCKSREGLK